MKDTVTSDNPGSSIAAFVRIQGVILVVLGVIVAAFARQFTYPIEILVGVALILSAALRLAGGLRQSTGMWAVAGAGASLVVGAVLLLHPRDAALNITIVLAILFFVEGIIAILAAVVLSRTVIGGAGLLVTGFVNLLLGMLLWQAWPSDAAWAIGLLVGVNLVMQGVALMSGASTWQRFTKDLAAPID